MDNQKYTTEYFIIQELKRLGTEIRELNKYVRDHMEKEELQVQAIKEELARFKWRVYGGITVLSVLFTAVMNAGVRIFFDRGF